MSAVDRFLQETLLRSKLSTSTSASDPSKLQFSPRTPQVTDTILPPYLTYDQLHSFLLFHRLQHLNNIITSSTSKYSHSAQEELSTLHSQIMQLQPNRTASAASKFRTSTCYKQGSKWHEIFWIPADDFPTVNFVGLLIGPRGNTLKRMETDSGARISIRGRGAEKEGKVRSDGSVAGGMDEPLHCMVMGDSETAVRRAIDLIRQVVDKAASSPEAEAEMKQNQLRELAMLNGTLRDGNDLVTCSNCGAVGHRKFECPERANVTALVQCRICGGSGHTTSDCVHRNNPEMVQAAKMNMMRMENEYLAFMNEIQSK